MPQEKITQIAREISGNYFGVYPSGHIKLHNKSNILFDYSDGMISGDDITFPEETVFKKEILINKIDNDWGKGMSIGCPTGYFNQLSDSRFFEYSKNLYGTLVSQDSDYMFVGLLNSGADKKTSIIGFGDNYGADSLDFVFFDYSTATVRKLMTISTGGFFITQDSSQSGSVVTNDRLNASGEYILDKAILDEDFINNGIMVRIAPETYASRIILADSGLCINYEDGVSGNPYLRIDDYNFNLINHSIQNTGDQTINGVKTFVFSPLIPDGSNQYDAVNFRQLSNTGQYLQNEIKNSKVIWRMALGI